MLKKLLKHLSFGLAALAISTGAALAAIDVNKADRSQLESVTGIGPSTAERILEERKKAQFRDWADFEKRVKGIGPSKAARLSAAGLTVNGEMFVGAKVAPTKKSLKKKGAEAAQEAKAEPQQNKQPAMMQ